jgi:hypothetical protein
MGAQKFLRIERHPWRKGCRFRIGGALFEVATIAEARAAALANGFAGIRVAVGAPLTAPAAEADPFDAPDRDAFNEPPARR